MEEKQEKVKIDYFKLIILIGVIFGFIFLILGILCWFSFLLVNRGGHCDIASVFSDLSRTPSLIFLIVSGLLNLTVLVYLKKDKDKFKTVRFFDNYYSCSDSNNNAEKSMQKGKCDENWKYTSCPVE